MSLARRNKRKDRIKKRRVWMSYIGFVLLLFGGAYAFATEGEETFRTGDWEIFTEAQADQAPISLEEIPPFDGTPYVEIDGNIPDFDETDYTTESFEYYSDFDSLGRCQRAFANVGIDLMPTEERGSVGAVKPSGWQTVKYDCVDGKYLYNRCHLIGYQLTGENANEKNLITGTRYLNVEGMLPFENMVADYVKGTGNHVLYRVTPVYEGSNPVASGVLMEGFSVEDQGRGVCFYVYVYNCQPGVEIDYATGESRLKEEDG